MTEEEKKEFKRKCRIFFAEQGAHVLNDYAKLLGVKGAGYLKRSLLIEECLSILCGEKVGKEYLTVISEEKKKTFTSYPLIQFVDDLKNGTQRKTEVVDELTARFASLPKEQKQMLIHILDAWLLSKAK